ncbi:MAG: filamentous hemagglutinin N-terminal domain-containing protein, partial [Helicobacter sp.]|nr:filamentous hemagglutinin N-terminal domain-containing protein [Helicobacter sp.]
MENKKIVISLILAGILYPIHSYSSDTRPRIGQNIIITPNEVNNLALSQNGTDVINIKSPDESGTSHNVFHKFDVNGKLIFNNSTSLGISQIGGIVGKNPNFRNMQTANAIVNEIKSTEASNISGILEVFGKKADLIFANENGLVVNGAIFLNTKGVTLTTGNLDNNLLTINNPSAIEIGEKGMSVDGEYANLIAGKINLAGSITSTNDIPLSNIALIAGKNKLIFNDKQFPGVAGELPDNDASYGIDGRLIGSMYANRVTFVASNEGIGVKHTGIISSPKDIIIISKKGDTQLHTVTTNSKNGSLTIMGNNISSTLISSDNIKMSANKNIDNHGILQATEISIKANSLNNLVTDKNFLNIEQHKDSNKYPTYMVGDILTLHLSDKLKNQGIINANSMNITSPSIDNSEIIMGNDAVFTLSNSIFKNSGKVTLNENLTINLEKRNKNLDLELGNTYAKNTLTVRSNSNLNINKKIENIGSISFVAPEIKNNSVIATPKNITISNTNKYYNFGHLFAGKNISLNTFTSIDNSRLIEGWGNIDISTKNLTNTASIFSKGDLDIVTKVLNNNSKLYGTVLSQRLSTIGDGGVNYGDTAFKTWRSNISLNNIPSYTNKLNTKQATIQSQGNLTINKNLPPQGNFVNNNGGIISAEKNIKISASINNTTLSNSLKVEDILRMIYIPSGVRNKEYLGSWNTAWANYFQKGGNLLQVLQYFSSSSLANHQKESAWNAIKDAASKNPSLHQYLSLYLGSNFAFNRSIPQQNQWNKNARLIFPSHNKAQIVSNQRIHIEANKVVQNLSTKLDTSFALLKSNVNLLSQTQKFIEQSLSEVRDNGFFIENKNSTTPIKYQYETPFSWIEQSDLYGSSYFFKEIEYSQKNYTVIGDSYFEYQLLNNMHGKISSNAHRLTNERIKTLMDNGVKYSKHNSVELGQTLTQNQINKLKEDIILYANLGTKAQPIFSPVIYFGQNTLKALN